MEPNINIYDVVISKKVKKPQDIKVGDVITFISTSSISKGMTITHRVVGIVESENGIGFTTKGDNNLSADTAPAEFNNVIGKVVLRVPQLGRVQQFIGTQGGWLIVIVIPALIIIISDILKIFKLAGVKNKIEKIDEDKKRQKEERTKREELRKQDIKKRLRLDKSFYEPDPIITKKITKVVVAEKAPKQKEKQQEVKDLSSNVKRQSENSSSKKSSAKRKKRKK